MRYISKKLLLMVIFTIVSPKMTASRLTFDHVVTHVSPIGSDGSVVIGFKKDTGGFSVICWKHDECSNCVSIDFDGSLEHIEGSLDQSYFYVITKNSLDFSYKAQVFYYTGQSYTAYTPEIKIISGNSHDLYMDSCVTFAQEGSLFVAQTGTKELTFYSLEGKEIQPCSHVINDLTCITAIAAHPNYANLLVIAGIGANASEPTILHYSLDDYIVQRKRSVLCMPEQIRFSRSGNTLCCRGTADFGGGMIAVMSVDNDEQAWLLVDDGVWQWDIAPDSTHLFFSTNYGDAMVWAIEEYSSITRLKTKGRSCGSFTCLVRGDSKKPFPSGKFNYDGSVLFINGQSEIDGLPAFFSKDKKAWFSTKVFQDIPLRHRPAMPLSQFFLDGAFARVLEYDIVID